MYQPKNLTDEAQDSVSAALNRSDAPSSENEDAKFAQAPNSGTLAYHNVLLNGYSAIDDHVGMFSEAETVWQPESNSVLPPHLLGLRQEGPSTGHDPMMNANANPNLANQLQPSDLAWMSIPSSSYSRPALQPTFGVAPGLHQSLPALGNTLLSMAPNDPKGSSRSVHLAREVSHGDSSNALNSTPANSYASDVTQPRLCSTCGTSDSPEWRRGADGRKTLCNACGLRHSRNESRIRRQQEKDRIVDEYVAGGGILYPQAAKSSQKPRERSSSHPSLSETSKHGITHVNNDIQRKSLPSESAEIQDELRPIDLYVDYQTAAAAPSNKSHEKQ